LLSPSPHPTYNVGHFSRVSTLIVWGGGGGGGEKNIFKKKKSFFKTPFKKTKKSTNTT